MSEQADKEHTLVDQRYGLQLGHSPWIRRATRGLLERYYRTYYRAEKLLSGIYVEALADKLRLGSVAGRPTLWMHDGLADKRDAA